MKNSPVFWLAGWLLLLPFAVAGQALVPFQEADAWNLRPAVWGYRDATGKMVIAPQYPNPLYLCVPVMKATSLLALVPVSLLTSSGCQDKPAVFHTTSLTTKNTLGQ